MRGNRNDTRAVTNECTEEDLFEASSSSNVNDRSSNRRGERADAQDATYSSERTTVRRSKFGDDDGNNTTHTNENNNENCTRIDTNEIETDKNNNSDNNKKNQRICRICHCIEKKTMPFVILGCSCKGSLAYAHKVRSSILFVYLF